MAAVLVVDDEGGGSVGVGFGPERRAHHGGCQLSAHVVGGGEIAAVPASTRVGGQYHSQTRKLAWSHCVLALQGQRRRLTGWFDRWRDDGEIAAATQPRRPLRG